VALGFVPPGLKKAHCQRGADVKCFPRSMSEFKFACPVCGQHMACDSSQAGKVMDCPTCFQKITAPQAPASDEQKFILTGSQVVERKNGGAGITATVVKPEADNKFLMAAAFLIVLLLAVGGALLGLRGKIFKSGEAQNPVVITKDAATPPVKPAIVAPHASDANWLLTLGTNAIPETPVAGRIHGQDFISERATFFNGTLTLREGTHGPLTFGVTINFSGALPETLSGQTINVGTNADTAARVTLRWPGDAEPGRASFDSGYALRLEFGALEKNRLPGKIYLCLPDAEKSYLLGTFTADARKPKPKQPKK
jgi:hypothetical protein